MKCFVKSLGIAFKAYIKRLPAWISEGVKVGILAIVFAVILTGLLLCIANLLGNNVPATMVALVIIVFVVMIPTLVSAMIATDFRRWIKNTGQPCNKESLDNYFAFKKKIGFSFGMSIWQYSGDECKHTVSHAATIAMKKKGVTLPTP